MIKNPITQIGVWLDQSKAYLIGYKNGVAQLLETIDSPYSSHFREAGEGSDHTKFGPGTHYTSGNENRKHNIAENELNEYFKLLEDKLTGYNDILLIGPGTAKERLRKKLSDNQKFAASLIHTKTSDRLSDNQLLEYVRVFYKNT
ncbi:hypothetical protein [Cyclobacterium jeungdonense]|uniref:Protein required for attachment to host cells n=1 Tax=Cyclobacterium jeungdonense TaxID=708087 RepID=A0ABT8CBH5_9BACT|nr:hypothetical protein [Cyclobacterium jeungdonense]MDN3690159.1 hypothetical protein [Cyclobacterium jeungdonense]